MTLNPIYNQSKYIARKKIFSALGGKLHIFNDSGDLLLFAEMKAFRLREDITLYSDETMGRELLRIKARKILDISSTYDVYDVETGETVGALRRKGLKSLFKDQWAILDTQDNEIGAVKEDNAFLALLRRAIAIIPLKYVLEIGGQVIPAFRHNFNPFVTKITADFSGDRQGKLDRRLGMAATILLCLIEGKSD
ncbi:hypothetical protein [Paenibacillus piscarius]|uniref:hypothetical protein n=1 Tax=Paenibacillus piscarius TaxID=1089681 RepID=UPI001EE83A1E|nr:hypothetical protein [Paenibacillus piscarius]